VRTGGGGGMGAGGGHGVIRNMRAADGSGSGFVPLRGGHDSPAWNASALSLDTGREGTSTPFTAYYPMYAEYAAGAGSAGSVGRQPQYNDEYPTHGRGATPEFDPYSDGGGPIVR